MNLGHLRHSVLITGLLASVIGMSACQEQPEPEASLGEDITTEQSMSAEPAEPSDTALATENDVDMVADDTVATVDGGVSQLTYLCTPALKIEATYKDDAGEVVLDTDQGTLTLMQTNEGSNPEVFEAQTAMDGGEGFTQWRVAHEARETGVMRMAGADTNDVTTYECNKSE